MAEFIPKMGTKLSSGLVVEYRPKIQESQRPNVGLTICPTLSHWAFYLFLNLKISSWILKVCGDKFLAQIRPV